MNSKSKLFVPYRAIGFVSNHIPLSLRYINRRNENIVVTCVGSAFHTYGCSKLNLLSISGQHPGDISCITSDAYLVFTACNNIVYAWRRGNELKHTYKAPSNVHLMLTFGPHLLAVYEDNTLLVWDIKEEVVAVEIPIANITVSAIVHPSTYLNKILLGSYEGCMQLINIKTCNVIYTFSGWGSPIVVLEQAPAVNVVAIGLESGDIYIHNLKYDETIMKFSQDWGPVIGITFRTDGPPVMATASTLGHVAVWDLEKKQLHSEIRDAHKGSVNGLKFLPNEPLLITSSSDNSIKIWIFDLPDDGGRLLHLREGHSNPPLKIRFHGINGKNILSSGLDSTLRSFSTEADNLNKNLGQASFNRKAAKKKGLKHDTQKMLPIVDFSSDITREKDWDNIAAIHRHSKIVSTWSYGHCRMGNHKLVPERFKGIKGVEALCVYITSCGNFVLIGYNTGHLDKFNIQSGLHRGFYGKDTAHDKSVRAVVVDSFNQVVISGGSDKFLRFWNFSKRYEVFALELAPSVCKIIIHKESAMLAVALDNFTVVVVDLESRKIVREFQDHDGAISDMVFSPDSRWLIVATMDSAIKTWNLPTGKLIDWFLVPQICTSLTMSPTGEYLATAHSGCIGIYLWANSVLYSNVSIHPLPESYDPTLVDLPLTSSENREKEEDIYTLEYPVIPEFKSPEQISDELATLSLLSQSHWLNLLDLHTIKLRNKPKEPVSVPKRAPFFLPVVSGLKPTFFVEDNDNWREEMQKSKILHVMQHGSEFFALLEKSETLKIYEPAIENLKSLSPSKINIEIQCLSPENGGSIHLMECFMRAMIEAMKTNKNIELVHSYLALFFQIHHEIVAAEKSLTELAETLWNMKTWQVLQEKIQFCLCVGNYARSAVL
ncbi:WD repeat-containing protein 36-like isoform X2 [Stegodyphus dumicola]|uniref:WD repeat-containing protein 36-like isoform X2 n=1 Tax=Stegodyphus dumicola TaxID=202533 RepID=UPI0015A93D7D|nr:WD repeat-containing protein 36-like isoform X2 [Stegodyphus dumicola]